jgi:hypothetical protein
MTFPENDTLDTYGGALNDAQPVEDPTTDRAAVAANQAYASAAAMTGTAPLAWCRFTADATTPLLAAQNGSNACWGNTAPVRPVVTHLGTGHYRVTYPTTVTDALGVVHTVNIKRAAASVEGAALQFASVVPFSGNIVDVYTFNAALAANDIVGSTLYLVIG